jgi:transcription initiation factor TFIID subunit 6
LAVEGVQPQIPQNPTIVDRNALGETIKDAPAASTAAASKKDVQDDAEVKPLVKHVLSKELQLYYDTLISDLLEGTADGNGRALKASLFFLIHFRNVGLFCSGS